MKRWLTASLAAMALMVSGCTQRSANDGTQTILAFAVSTLEKNTARPLSPNTVKAIQVAPGVEPAVAREAARIRPTSIANAAGPRTRLQSGEVLITEFRRDRRSAHVTFLVGPTDDFPTPHRPPILGRIEKMQFERKPDGRWVLVKSEGIQF